MHGRNDARCLPRQIKHFIDVLRSFGKRVSVEWFSSGHVGEFTDTALRVKLMSKAIQFAVNERNKIAPHGRMGLL
jgi:predicted esterase